MLGDIAGRFLDLRQIVQKHQMDIVPHGMAFQTSRDVHHRPFGAAPFKGIDDENDGLSPGRISTHDSEKPFSHEINALFYRPAKGTIEIIVRNVNGARLDGRGLEYWTWEA